MSSQDDNQKSNTTKLRALLEHFRRAIEAKAPRERFRAAIRAESNQADGL